MKYFIGDIKDQDQIFKDAIKELYKIDSVEIIKSDNGKPYVKDNLFYFNKSHSNGLVVYAFDNNEIGVDIELIRDYDVNLPYLIFSRDEINKIKSSKNKNKTFFELWTLKEAYLKLHGKTLKEMSFIDVDLNIYNVEQFEKDNYIITIVYKKV